MATKPQDILFDIWTKNDVGEIQKVIDAPSTFETTVDTRANKGNYSLAQFFDHYIEFMQNADFIYYGAEKPANVHNRIWIDTSKTNQE